ncbi:MAG: restriction endonuclease subunit S [Prevotella sp.]|nr:restriction endonuclease subunit S [Prevotella sp.]
MVEWKELGQLGKFENIGTDKKIIEGEKLVTLLNYVDVYHHKYIDSSVPQMQVSASDKKIEDCTVEQGDIFVTPSSETVDDIGHASVITETIPNAVYSYHIMRYRMFEKNMLLSYYINYAFDTENVKKQILKKAQGLTRFGLSKDKFASIQIPIPSLSEQQRIVGILDTFAASIDNLKEQIIQRRKQFEYYRDQLLNLEGKEGVEMKHISDVAKNFTGLTYKPENVSNEGTLVLRSSNIDEDILAFDDNVFVQMAIPERATVKENDILICVRNGSKRLVGKAAMITKKAEGMAFGAFMTILRCFEIDCKYLFFVWQSERVKKQYKGDEAMPIAQITAKDFQRIIIPVPSLSEQQRIVCILDTFEASIQNLEAQLKQREKQYEYYRNKLLTF